MLKNLCKMCSSRITCNYCITYGKMRGQEIYKTRQLCQTCCQFGKCTFCKKFGEKDGKKYYKYYIDYIKESS